MSNCRTGDVCFNHYSSTADIYDSVLFNVYYGGQTIYAYGTLFLTEKNMNIYN